MRCLSDKYLILFKVNVFINSSLSSPLTRGEVGDDVNLTKWSPFRRTTIGAGREPSGRSCCNSREVWHWRKVRNFEPNHRRRRIFGIIRGGRARRFRQSIGGSGFALQLRGCHLMFDTRAWQLTHSPTFDIRIQTTLARNVTSAHFTCDGIPSRAEISKVQKFFFLYARVTFEYVTHLRRITQLKCLRRNLSFWNAFRTYRKKKLTYTRQHACMRYNNKHAWFRKFQY